MATKHTTTSDTPVHSEDTVADLEAKILTLNEEIVTLRAKVFTLRDELHVLRNSRVVGRIIKTRDHIGDPKTISKRAINSFQTSSGCL